MADRRKPTQLHRSSDGRFYVTFEHGRLLWISHDDVDAWRKRIEEHQGVASTKRSSKSKGSSTSAPAATSSTTLRMSGRVDLDYDERELGWILRGFVEAARGGGPQQDPARIFESRDDDDSAKERAKHAKLLDLGRELFGTVGAAASYFRVSDGEWAMWLARARSGMPSSTPMLPAGSTGADLSPIAWYPPVRGPITSRFGARAGKEHEGIDIAVPVGTEVRAPQTMRITKVDRSDSAGIYVEGNTLRDTGEQGELFGSDGYRVTFMHLQDASVRVGDVVRRGEVIGASGNTGNSTGPHLHLQVAWVVDRLEFLGKWDGGLLDKVIPVDPLSLIPESAFATGVPGPAPGGVMPTATTTGQPVNVIVAPGSGKVSIGGNGIINPDTDVRVGSPTVQSSTTRFVPGVSFAGYQTPRTTWPQPAKTAAAAAAPPPQAPPKADDPLGDILDVVGDVVGGIFSPDGLKAIGGIAAAGGTLASLIPGAQPVSVPVAAAGAVIAGAGSLWDAVDGETDPVADFV
jgi:murein DD-endopeptidase MepM/ murein hydrolase activator NlpD